MSRSSGTAIATIRLMHDAWRHDDVAELQHLKRMLSETENDELRSTVEHLCRLTVGLAVVLAESPADFTFDQWLADAALTGLPGDAA